MGPAHYWDQLYADHEPGELSWYEEVPTASLTLIEEAAIPSTASILDVGAGTSRLAGLLIEAGHTDVTVADISDTALARAQTELGAAAAEINWIAADVRSHDFGRMFELWHDRAVFHFMVEETDRQGYLTVLRRTLRPGGHLVLASFGPDGPTQCSGLPVARYRADELADTLGSDFDLITARTQGHRTPTGKNQQFTYTHFQRRLPP